MASAETTQTPAIIAVLPAISVKAERGMISSTTRIVRTASARMVMLASTRATPLWLRISDVCFLWFEVHGWQSYAGCDLRAGQAGQQPLNGSHLGRFLARAVRQCTAYCQVWR